ncbi:MAG: D-alanyl-D-alanine carboxypeptidase family protein [Candidatus Nealsonbacteria bacterium]
MKKNIITLAIFLISVILFWKGMIFFQKNLEDFFYAQISEPLQEMAFVKIPPKKAKPDLHLESAISVKINKSGKEKILLRKSATRTMPIASLTKLMTALIVLENTPQNDYDFSKVVMVSKTAADQDNVPVYGNLKEEEAFSIEELLDLMLIYSSNDAAFALSEVIGEELFIEKMNQKAQSLGLKNTYFTNSTGLDPEDQEQIPNYSTAQDLATFSKYILNNYPLIFKISLEKGPYSTTNGLSDLYILNEQKIVGGKTGYTEKAGACMLLILEDEKENYFINIILGTDSPKERIQEMQKIIDWIAL